MQTLKPCPFCNGSAEIVEDCGSFFSRCENSACPPAPQTPLVDDADTAASDWNTRPAPPISAQSDKRTMEENPRHNPILSALKAVRKENTLAQQALVKLRPEYTRPAAPVEGLKTSLWRCQMGEYAVATTVNKTEAEDWKKHTVVEEYVTRSQAEELLAAELRRERDLAAKQLSEVVDRMSDDYLALKADNTALTARVKAFVEYEQEAEGMNEVYLYKIEALEAKLAAAEKFIQFCADGFFVTDDELRGAARATLEYRP